MGRDKNWVFEFGDSSAPINSCRTSKEIHSPETTKELQVDNSSQTRMHAFDRLMDLPSLVRDVHTSIVIYH